MTIDSCHKPFCFQKFGLCYVCAYTCLLAVFALFWNFNWQGCEQCIISACTHAFKSAFSLEKLKTAYQIQRQNTSFYSTHIKDEITGNSNFTPQVAYKNKHCVSKIGQDESCNCIDLPFAIMRWNLKNCPQRRANGWQCVLFQWKGRIWVFKPIKCRLGHAFKAALIKTMASEP